MNQHAGAFSPCTKYFANISDDGKLKVWNVETTDLTHDYSPGIVNNSPCTCLTWISLKHGQSKKSRRLSASGQDFLALGTTMGGVMIFSLATGKVEHTLKGQGHMGAVTAICTDSSGTLLTSGEDCKVISWDLAKGAVIGDFSTSNERLTCLGVTASGEKIITASRQVRLWMSSTHQCKQTFTGHTSTVTHLSLVTVGESEYAISASKMERSLSMWSLEASKKKEAVGTFILDDLVVTLDVTAHESGLQILAATRNGVLHCFEESLEKILASVKPLKAKWRISLVTDDRRTAECLPVVAAKLTDAVLVAYGGAGCLRFENLTPKKESHEILIREDPRKVKTGKEASGKHAVVDYAKVDYVLGGEAKRTMKMTEIPMEKRLENLALSKDQGAGTVTPAKNMHYLIQALHSRDQNVLQDVLLTKDKNSIRTTLKYLSPQYIKPLTTELTLFMQKKIKHVECATSWMQVLIELHAGQLMAIGAEDLRDQMRPFLGVVEHRVHNLQTLTRVRGRLDLILSQIRGKSEVDRDEIAKINKNLIVHQDEASESESEIGLEEMNNEEGWEDTSSGSESDDSEEVEGDDDQEMAENEEMEVSD